MALLLCNQMWPVGLKPPEKPTVSADFRLLCLKLYALVSFTSLQEEFVASALAQPIHRQKCADVKIVCAQYPVVSA